jgi:hypothetical protein
VRKHVFVSCVVHLRVSSVCMASTCVFVRVCVALIALTHTALFVNVSVSIRTFIHSSNFFKTLAQLAANRHLGPPSSSNPSYYVCHTDASPLYMLSVYALTYSACVIANRRPRLG